MRLDVPGETCCKDNLARYAGRGEVRNHLSEYHLIDFLRIQLGALHQLLDHHPTKVQCGKIAENRPRLDEGGSQSSDNGHPPVPVELTGVHQHLLSAVS